MAGRNISNSEVTAWLTCRLQYYFAHYLNLEPKVMSVPLFRGNLGHLAFQRYAEARIEGKSHEASMQDGLNVFTQAKMQDIGRIEVIMNTQMIWMKYMTHHKGWPEWRILGTEQRHDLPLTENFNISTRYDIMVQEIASSKVLIGDFKFTYDFWRPEEHNLNVQMPKYIKVLNANGLEIHGGFLEELRTRQLSEKNGNANDPKQLFRRTRYFPSPALKNNALRQHVGASIEIDRFWSASDSEREALAIPVFNKHGACKVCNFKEVCGIKLAGGDWQYQLEREFQPNTYGYNEMESAE